MVRPRARWWATARRCCAAVAGAAVLTACAGDVPVGTDAPPPRPYLVSVDDPQATPGGEIAATLVEEEGCVLLDTEGGLVFPLFTVRTRFGPLDDGGRPTIDVDDVRLRFGQEVRLAGGLSPIGEGARSRYPGVDFTRCPADRFALVGSVRGR